MFPIRSKHALTGPYWVGSIPYDAPLPPGWLPGDEVNPITGEYKRNKPRPVVGIVDMVGKVRYGFSSRGVPQYLFHPLDPAWPPMIVGSKAAPTHNQIGVAVFDSWDSKMKWSRGALQELLGPVGNTEVEQKALQKSVCIQAPKSMTVEIPEVHMPEEIWDVTMNVDPPGCRDVDDVFSWRTRNGITEFAITIADVSALVPPGSDMDRVAKQKAQTVYEEGRILESMLPREVEEAGSLLADGVTRPGLSAVWTLGPEGPKGPRWISALVKNQYTFTYESILEHPLASTVKDYLQQIVGPLSEDSHEWVEKAMITYNTEAAILLHTAANGLLRRHRGATGTSAKSLHDMAIKTGCKELAFLGYAAGEYVSAEEEDVRHVGLSKDMYCHASSPLRRYADLVNQRVLKTILFTDWDTEVFAKGREEMPLLAQQLMDRSRAIKAFERGMWCLKHVSSNGVTSAEGFVIGWKPCRYPGQWRVSVYVPTWKRTVKISLMGNVEEGVFHEISSQRFWSSGDCVTVKAFCDAREPRWEHRYIFSIL
jgi:exoribonuclease R